MVCVRDWALKCRKVFVQVQMFGSRGVEVSLVAQLPRAGMFVMRWLSMCVNEYVSGLNLLTLLPWIG